MNEHTG